MEIKKGMKFRCIKDVVMNNKDKGIAYKKGNIYMSEMDNKITDEWKDIRHGWADDNGEVLKDTELYFEEIKEPMNYDLEKTVVHCTTQEEFDKVVEWNFKQDYTQYPANHPSEWYRKYYDRTYVELKNYFGFGNVDDLDTYKLVISFSQFERDFLNKEDDKPILSPKEVEPSVKNDFKDNKLRWDLLPLDLIEELVKVYDYGAKKYYPESWKEIPDGYQRLKAAALRHLVAFEKGEEIDPESGLPHLIQSSWNLLTCYYYANKKENNHGK